MNPLLASSRPVASVTVEYDARGQRVAKTFTDIYAARSFYAVKVKQGKNPRVVGAVRS